MRALRALESPAAPTASAATSPAPKALGFDEGLLPGAAEQKGSMTKKRTSRKGARNRRERPTEVRGAQVRCIEYADSSPSSLRDGLAASGRDELSRQRSSSAGRGVARRRGGGGGCYYVFCPILQHFSETKSAVCHARQ